MTSELWHRYRTVIGVTQDKYVKVAFSEVVTGHLASLHDLCSGGILKLLALVWIFENILKEIQSSVVGYVFYFFSVGSTAGIVEVVYCMIADHMFAFLSFETDLYSNRSPYCILALCILRLGYYSIYYYTLQSI